MSVASRAGRRCPAVLSLGLVALLLCAIPSAASAQDSIVPLDVGPDGRLTYFVANGAPDSGFEEGDRELARWALQAWAAASGDKLRLELTSEEQALVRVYFVGAQGGQYGEMRPLRVGDRRGAAVFVRPDLDGLGPEIAARAVRDPLWRDAIVYLTCLHELGHAVGLAHTDRFADIMYSFQFGGDVPAYFARYRDRLRSRADIARTSALSDDDTTRVRSLYRSLTMAPSPRR